MWGYNLVFSKFPLPYANLKCIPHKIRLDEFNLIYNFNSNIFSLHNKLIFLREIVFFSHNLIFVILFTIIEVSILLLKI